MNEKVLYYFLKYLHNSLIFNLLNLKLIFNYEHDFEHIFS